MPGFVTTFLSPVVCAHGGKATPIPPAGRVLVMGQAVITTGYMYAITGCSFITPCVAGIFTVGALRVSSSGLPVVILPSFSNTAPTGVPMLQLPAGQMRVRAT